MNKKYPKRVGPRLSTLQKKVKPCLKCDKPTLVTKETRLCYNCHSNNRWENTLDIGMDTQMVTTQLGQGNRKL